MRLGPGDRRHFLKQSLGDWVERMMTATEERVIERRYLRPPGALPEMAFLAACSRCGECLPVCPVGAIVKVPSRGGIAAGTPEIDTRRQPCIGCPDMPCVTSCPTGALTRPDQGWEGYHLGRVEFIPERCITFRGTTCQACADACPVGERALVMDRDGHPVLRSEGCIGCGVCLRECIAAPPAFSFHLAERT